MTRRMGYLDEMGNPTLSSYVRGWTLGNNPELVTFGTPWFAVQIGRGGVAHRKWSRVRFCWAWKMWSGFTREWATR